VPEGTIEVTVPNPAGASGTIGGTRYREVGTRVAKKGDTPSLEQLVNWTDLRLLAEQRPGGSLYLMDCAIAAVTASRDVVLHETIAAKTPTLARLCTALDEHRIEVPQGTNAWVSVSREVIGAGGTGSETTARYPVMATTQASSSFAARTRDPTWEDSGILPNVPGECIASASKQLPDPETATVHEITTVIDAAWLGQVRVRFHRAKARHHKQAHWFWNACWAGKLSTRDQHNAGQQ
jgi:hypothetical protein